MGNVPSLRFPEFSGAWEKQTLHNVSRIFDGTHQTPTYKDRGIKFLSVENISNIEGSNKFISRVDFEKTFKVIPEINDILMTRIGDIGSPAIIKDSKPYAYYVSLALIKCIKELIEPLYLYQYINTDIFQHELHNRTLHIAFPKKINLGEIGKCIILLPTLTEQTKIANFLALFDKKIEKQIEKVAALEEYKNGLMQKIFSREIRFKDDDGKDYPEWSLVKFSDLFEAIPTKNYQISTKEYAVNGLYEVVDQGQDVVVGYSSNESKVFHDLPIIIYGDHTTIVKYRDQPFIVGADGTKLLKAKKGNHRFAYYGLCFCNINPEGYKRHYSIVKNIMIPQPSIPEQTKIANFLTLFDRKIEKEKAKLDALREQKKGLLQQMFV